MANKRCLPTRFFKDPDIMNLSNRETQLILVGLVLIADDEGRELAHSKLLGRELDYPTEQIEAALHDLVANDLLILYQVGKHRYFSLTRWGHWQTLSSNKITLSKYPAPPLPETIDPSGTSQDSPEFPTKPPGNSEEVGKTPAQLNVIESNLGEVNGSEDPPNNVTPFPIARADTVTGDVHAQIETTTKEVAQILKLPVCHALTRLVTASMQDMPDAAHLLIEADAAREWIDDRKRNRAGKTMTINFFRNWLKRDRKELHDRLTPQMHGATGTDDTTPREELAPRSALGAPRRKSLMGLEAEYRAACERKEKP